MILTTATTLDGFKITHWLGMVRAWRAFDPFEERYRTVEVPRRSRKAEKEPKLKNVKLDWGEAFNEMFDKAQQDPLDFIASAAANVGGNCVLGIQYTMAPLSTTSGEINGIGGGGNYIYGGGGQIVTSHLLVVHVYGTAAYCVAENEDESATR